MTQAETTSSAAPGRGPLARPDVERADGDRGGPLGWLIGALPLLVPAAMVGVSLVVMLTLLAHVFVPALVLPLAVVAALLAVAAAAGAVPRRRVSAGALLVDLAALVFAAAWVAVNARYSSQEITVFRDPAGYALTSQWLVHHSGLPINAHPGVFGNVAGLSSSSAFFGTDPKAGYLYAQGAHLAPALWAPVGWLFGPSALLHANVVIGGIALLAVYAFARLVVRRGFALAAVVGLGLTLPQLHFARSTYSEPSAEFLLFVGFALLWQAHATGRRVVFALAGLALGLVATSRIDGLFNLLGVIVYLGWLLATARPGERRVAGERALLVGLPTALGAAIGITDLKTLAPGYWADLAGQRHTIALGAIALAVVAAVVVALAWSTRLPQRIVGWRPLPVLLGGLLVLIVAVLASRPAWEVAMLSHPSSSGGYVPFLQKAYGQPIQPDRSYAELTMNWVWWYTGLLTAVLGTLGLALLVVRVVRRGEPALAAFLVTVLMATLLYSVAPNIVPDQIWATRRLLPLTFPAVAIGAGYLLDRLAARRWNGRPVALPSPRLALAGVVGVLVALSAIPASQHLWRVREFAGNLHLYRSACVAAGPRAALLVVGSLNTTSEETLRSYCDVPTDALPTATSAALTQVRAAAAARGRTLYVVAGADLAASAAPAWLRGPVRPLVTTAVTHWNARLTQPARYAGTDPEALYVGKVAGDGTVTLLH